MRINSQAVSIKSCRNPIKNYKARIAANRCGLKASYNQPEVDEFQSKLGDADCSYQLPIAAMRCGMPKENFLKIVNHYQQIINVLFLKINDYGRKTIQMQDRRTAVSRHFSPGKF
jgi:hypothetical protein